MRTNGIDIRVSGVTAPVGYAGYAGPFRSSGARATGRTGSTTVGEQAAPPCVGEPCACLERPRPATLVSLPALGDRRGARATRRSRALDHDILEGGSAARPPRENLPDRTTMADNTAGALAEVRRGTVDARAGIRLDAIHCVQQGGESLETAASARRVSPHAAGSVARGGRPGREVRPARLLHRKVRRARAMPRHGSGLDPQPEPLEKGALYSAGLQKR
jgi:hypothetical protein